jgi:hypothetical protein
LFFVFKTYSFCLQHTLDAEAVKNDNIDDLTPGERQTLNDWMQSYSEKYTVAGELVSTEQEKREKTIAEQKRYDLETEALKKEEEIGKAKM